MGSGRNGLIDLKFFGGCRLLANLEKEVLGRAEFQFLAVVVDFSSTCMLF